MHALADIFLARRISGACIKDGYCLRFESSSVCVPTCPKVPYQYGLPMFAFAYATSPVLVFAIFSTLLFLKLLIDFRNRRFDEHVHFDFGNRYALFIEHFNNVFLNFCELFSPV